MYLCVYLHHSPSLLVFANMKGCRSHYIKYVRLGGWVWVGVWVGVYYCVGGWLGWWVGKWVGMKDSHLKDYNKSF